MMNMKVTKCYILAVNDMEEYVFSNENDRNEMALAIYQEDMYNRFALIVNWYSEYYNELVQVLGVQKTRANLRVRAHNETMEDMFTYEASFVED